METVYEWIERRRKDSKRWAEAESRSDLCPTCGMNGLEKKGEFLLCLFCGSVFDLYKEPLGRIRSWEQTDLHSFMAPGGEVSSSGASHPQPPGV